MTRQAPAAFPRQRGPRRIGQALAFALAFAAAPAAKAASLQQVNGWGVSGLPSDVSMSIYVPDDVTDNPPILTLIHYCGGTASAVFGQAQGGGLVRAADQYGFIIVVPSSGRCWDVQSNRTRTRDGLGDSHAIVQMVRYAIETRHGNAQRVYATGDSSGGMMTELLLALYPDVFKAGSAMAGMPAACRATNESGNGGGYSGACAGGMVTHTPQEWGDIARMLYPEYTGHRPRAQLFHGDADTTIRYANHTEAIKEWTNLLGLAASPTNSSTVTLGTHQATRQRWENDCGYTVVDAFSSMGGDHGPSDALFLSEYVVPFLGLDDTGAVDPEIAECGQGGGGAGGASGSAGSAGGGAGGSAGSGGSGSGAGGNAGGSTAGGSGLGNAGASGSVAAGGNAGMNASGGGGASGAPSSMGGNPSAGGTPSAGAVGTGGAGAGGRAASAGTSSLSGGSANQGVSGGATQDDPAGAESPGCGCTVVGTGSKTPRFGVVAGMALALAAGRLKRRRRS